ncbi:hypothetical protein Hypma_013975 [Hypsizygus marmoreus]|uniref:Uncharacterized protein n=1 Tax=Hypsizygus marmoreus TaxID=39966 RepID=A0A369K7I4_HYPMA|nr:hypothetical protein Hypma_013975 [Hypsizygus marmoreus]
MFHTLLSNDIDSMVYTSYALDSTIFPPSYGCLGYLISVVYYAVYVNTKVFVRERLVSLTFHHPYAGVLSFPTSCDLLLIDLIRKDIYLAQQVSIETNPTLHAAQVFTSTTSTTKSCIADRPYAEHTRYRPHIRYFARNREQMNLFMVYVYTSLTIPMTEQETRAAGYCEVRDSVDKMGPEGFRQRKGAITSVDDHCATRRSAKVAHHG